MKNMKNRSQTSDGLFTHFAYVLNAQNIREFSKITKMNANVWRQNHPYKILIIEKIKTS